MSDSNSGFTVRKLSEGVFEVTAAPPSPEQVAKYREEIISIMRRCGIEAEKIGPTVEMLTENFRKPLVFEVPAEDAGVYDSSLESAAKSGPV